MTMRVDLNADMGESFGAWSMGEDAALLDIVTSANVACGFHAGDWDVMAATMAAAAQRGVSLGAHPGLPDLQGFGRRRMAVSPESAGNLVRYQLGAAQAMARAAGTELRHLKLHGALYNMAAEDEGLARACFEAALSVAPDITLFVLPATAQDRAARALGANMACEVFADRAYDDDGTLLDRSQPGAVLHDTDAIAERAVEMVTSGTITAASGKVLATSIDTICLHGDSPGAVEAARAVRTALEAAGVTLARP